MVIHTHMLSCKFPFDYKLISNKKSYTVNSDFIRDEKCIHLLINYVKIRDGFHLLGVN